MHFRFYTTFLILTYFTYIIIFPISIYPDSFTSQSPSKPITKAPGAPKAPSELTAELISPQMIELEWLDNSNDEDGFGIQIRYDEQGEWSPLASTPSNVSIYQHYPIGENHTYCYRVFAFTTTGIEDSGFSNVACVYVPLTIPQSPDNLNIQSISSSRNRLTWNDRSYNEAGFGIEYKINNGPWSLLTTVPEENQVFYHNDLTNGITYCYQVYAYNAAGNSNYSNNTCSYTGLIPTSIPFKQWLIYP